MRESELLKHIYQANAALPVAVTLPPGDDMGAVRLDGTDVLVTVDQVADGVHVDSRTMPLEKIGRKAVTRNLSDVAAMAARPAGAVVAACLPRDFGQQRANALFDAMRDTAAQYDCPLIGGDIAMWDHPLLLTVTIFAVADGIEPVLRKGACIGDAVCVTGELGGSLAGHHLDFEPRLGPARALASDPRTRPHCLIDLSDGLAKDLAHLCRAAHVSAELIAEHLPIRAAAHDLARTSGQPAWRHALGDGEDYELCFTMPPDRVPREAAGVPVTVIGRIVDAGDVPRITLQLPDGGSVAVEDLGWEHRT